MGLALCLYRQSDSNNHQRVGNFNGLGLGAAVDHAPSSELGEAIERHGLEELQLMQAEKPFAAPKMAASTYLSVALLHRIEELDDSIKPVAVRTLNLTPEVRAASAAFKRLAEIMLEAALLSANLLRLAREYRRTERRARALENVLLPEVSAMLKHVTEQLDAFDQEEAARAHTRSRSPSEA